MSRHPIKNKRQAKKAGLGGFYQQMTEFLSEDGKGKPILRIFDQTSLGMSGEVVVGLQDDHIWSWRIEQLPKPWTMIRTDDGEHDTRGQGEQLLEVTYDLNKIGDNKETRSKDARN